MISLSLTGDGDTTTTVPGGSRFTVAVSGAGIGTIDIQYRAGGQWFDFVGGETGTFTEAGEREFTNIGDSSRINVSASGTTAAKVVLRNVKEDIRTAAYS